MRAEILAKNRLKKQLFSKNPKGGGEGLKRGTLIGRLRSAGWPEKKEFHDHSTSPHPPSYASAPHDNTKLMWHSLTIFNFMQFCIFLLMKIKYIFCQSPIETGYLNIICELVNMKREHHTFHFIYLISQINIWEIYLENFWYYHVLFDPISLASNPGFKYSCLFQSKTKLLSKLSYSQITGHVV